MDNKNKFWKGVMVGVFITALVCLVTVGASIGIYMFGRQIILNAGSGQEGSGQEASSGEAASLDMGTVTAKLDVLLDLINEVYLFDTDPALEEAGIYKGLMYSLGDLYADYYTPEEMKVMEEETAGEYCGIGAMISQDRLTYVSTVTKVYKDSPAEEGGLQAGDILFKVDGVDVSAMDLDEIVSQHVRGEENTPVTLTVYRNGEEAEVTMTRRQLEMQTVEYEMLSDAKTGYILVTEFDTVTADQFKTAVDSLVKQGMEQLVLDLRNNPGGELNAAVAMIDYLLPDGKTIVSIADKNGEGETYSAEDGHQLNVPAVILVNGNSASASEVFTGAMKDHGMATVVGTKTFGKGIVQSLYTLQDGSGVKLTTEHYYTPGGTDIHGTGIEPDVTVELDEELLTEYEIPKEKDNQLAAALDVLNGTIDAAADGEEENVEESAKTEEDAGSSESAAGGETGFNGENGEPESTEADDAA